jgi:hypothetical protein
VIFRQLRLWQPTMLFCAELSHCGWGSFAVLAALYHGWPWLIPVFIVIAAGKEFLWDAVQEGDSFSLNLLDFVMYLAGGLIGFLTWWF